MALLITVIAIALQRFLKFGSYSYQYAWAESYYGWINQRVKFVAEGHPLLGLAILVVPIVFVASVFFPLIQSLLGTVGYFIMELLLAWYCLDARDLHKEPYSDMGVANIFSQSYQNLFAILFWFGVFGPVGLVLYICVSRLSHAIPIALPAPTTDASVPSVHDRGAEIKIYCQKLLAILDWVPVRLLGLSFALVGSFGAVFKRWIKEVVSGLDNPQALVVEWGQSALKDEKTNTGGDASSEAVDLIDRSLLVWLVVFFLVTLGVLLG